MKSEPRPCRCGCGQVFTNRARSLALCQSGYARLYAGIEALPLLGNSHMARQNLVRVDLVTVQAILDGDMAEAERRLRHRAAHGLYSDPGPKPAAVAA